MNEISTKLLPCGDRLIVKEIIADKKKMKECSSGLVLPDSSKKENLIEGEILAVGPGMRTPEGNIIPSDFKIGDRVLFSKHMGDSYTYNDVKYLIVNSLEIMLKITQ